MQRKMLLQKQLSEASQKYYSDGSSNMSDTEFDKKLKELKELDPENPVVTEVGHGYKVSSDSTYGTKENHKYGLVGSLDKVHNWGELSKDLKHCNVVCSLKLDGISCVLYYTNGALDKALTRGDGIVGVNITDKVQVIAPDLQYLSINNVPFTGAVRGELLMDSVSFEVYLNRHSDAKNPRNTTAGLINRKEYNKDDLSLVSLVLYSIVGCDDLDKYNIKNQYDVFNSLQQVHSVAPFASITDSLNKITFDYDMSSFVNQFSNSSEVQYPFDGVVIADYTLNLNSNTHQVTWKSQAYKFEAEKKQTTVTDIEWNLSKTAYLIPKVRFNTVELSGTDVSYATAFNAKYVMDNNLKPGSKVTITKSGEIIPYIVSIDEVPDTEYTVPSTCPSCHEPLTMCGVHLTCNNEKCPDKGMWDLVIWIKTIAEVDGLSDTLISKYVSRLEWRSVKDLYTSDKSVVAQALNSSSRQDMLFAEAVARCETKHVKLSTAIQACNIPRFGEKNSKLCDSCFDDVLSLARTGLSCESLSDKLGGVANYTSLVNHMDKLSNILLIENNLEKLEPVKHKGSVCITGKLSMKRKDFESLLEANGYQTTSSVTQNTDWLITNTPNSTSSKNKKASDMGIPKITEADFLKEFIYDVN